MTTRVTEGLFTALPTAYLQDLMNEWTVRT